MIKRTGQVDGFITSREDTRLITTGGDGAPTFTITETEKISDKLIINPLKLNETERRGDGGIIFNPLKLNETERRGDAVLVPLVTLTSSELIHKAGELFTATVNWDATAHSVTPNTDAWGDGWVDSLLANQGDNHGDESPLPIDGALLSATQNDAFMEVDLTRFTGFSVPSGGTMTLTIHAVQALAVAQTFTAVFSKFVARPFQEMTLNFTNKPADGTDTVTKNVSVLVGAVPSNYSMVLTASEYTPFLGNFMMIRFSSTAVLATPINISSREDTTVSNRQNLIFSLMR